MRHQVFRRKHNHNPCARQPGHGRKRQAGKNPYMPQMDQQISRAAEPRQEHRQAHGIEKSEPTRVRSMLPRAMPTCMTCPAEMNVPMREMKMQMQRAAQKRKRGKGKAHNETDQIEKFPVHSFTSFN